MRKRLDELYKVELVQRVKVATQLCFIDMRFHLTLSLSISFLSSFVSYQSDVVTPCESGKCPVVYGSPLCSISN